MYFLEQFEYIRTKMKAITLNYQNSFKAKHILTAGVLAITGLLAPATASASLVSGTAAITIDNTAFAAANSFGNIVDTHWGASDNTLTIDGATTGGTTLAVNGSTAMEFAVNTNSTTNIVSTIGSGRTEQETTMDASDTSTGQIGLSGAMRINGPGGLLVPYDFRLTNTSGTWNIATFDAGFGYNDFLKLTNVNESVNEAGELLLNGDLQITGLWAFMLGADTSVVGTFNLAPSAVPVPAAVWLFGTGLIGLIGVGKRKKI